MRLRETSPIVQGSNPTPNPTFSQFSSLTHSYSERALKIEERDL